MLRMQFDTVQVDCHVSFNLCNGDTLFKETVKGELWFHLSFLFRDTHNVFYPLCKETAQNYINLLSQSG